MKKQAFLLILALLCAVGCTGAPDAPAAEEASTPIPAASKTDDAQDQSEPVTYTNITVSVRRDSQVVSERAVTGAEGETLVEGIVFDYMVRSAAWEGIEVSELEDCILLSFDWTSDDGRQTFYQYDVEGGHALQWGEAGRYTLMSDDAYAALRKLAGLTD